jgi:hypothetical protein
MYSSTSDSECADYYSRFNASHAGASTLAYTTRHILRAGVRLGFRLLIKSHLTTACEFLFATLSHGFQNDG